jgi:L-alanine-DL-glutamate epimerase-like enolase superfamily enzyme
VVDILRRRFTAGLAATALPHGAAAQFIAERNKGGALAYASNEFAPLIDFRALVDYPVIIDAIEVLDHSDNTKFVRVRSKDGAQGVIVANKRLWHTYSLLDTLFRPVLLGKDARDIQRTFDLLFRISYPRGYKYSSMPYFIIQGHIELAVMDMFGRMLGRSVAALSGAPKLDDVAVYMSRLSRDTSAEEEIDIAERYVAETGARAVKVKIGGRMRINADASPGRTDALVSGLRKRLGDDMVIYVDANGSYDAPTAIRVGRMLEDHGVAFYEEPCEWEDFEMTKQVADTLDIPVAGGEQDTSLPKWRWMAEHGGVDILQPDIMYNGGFIRTMMVADIAKKYGRMVAPHYPRSGPETAPLMHFVASIDNFEGFMEYRADQNKTDFDYEPIIKPVNGVISLPKGPGFGVQYDAKVLNPVAR